MDAAFRSFDGDVFLHHQLGFLFPKSRNIRLSPNSPCLKSKNMWY
jgi:hypothetical protein